PLQRARSLAADRSPTGPPGGRTLPWTAREPLVPPLGGLNAHRRMDSADLWLQFGQIVIAHGLAVASPGPDFALVLRQSLARGRTVALWTSVGIGSGILVHVSYSLLGLGLLLAASGM